MSEEVKLSAIKDVQDSLGKYVKKPPLTEKLLRKPPFRYLHDIVSAVIRETGLLDGLYTAEELDSNNVKDKESKIAFLEKLIAAVKTTSDSNISVRPAKIVAGLEVNKTLELLRALGQAIDNKISISQFAPEQIKKQENTLHEPSKIVSNDGVGDEVINSLVNGDLNASDSKDDKTKTHVTSDSKEISMRKQSLVSSTGEKTRRTSVIGKRDKLKQQPPSAKTTETKSVNKESASTRTLFDKNKKTKDISIPNNRSSTQSRSTPVRKSSLKESNRNVINPVTNLQSSIKEEKEDIPVLSKENTKPEKSMPVIVNLKSKEALEVPTKHVEKQESADLLKTNQTEKDSTETAEIIDKSDQAENKPSSSETSQIKRKESTPVQRPGSARPGSRKFVYSDSKNSAENNATNERTDKNADDLKNSNLQMIRPRTATRPPSARPGAPKIRDRGEVSTTDEAVVISNPVNVIEEGKQDQFADDKDSFILIESQQSTLPLEDVAEINDTDQGQLVNQILKTQKELNKNVINDRAPNKHSEIEWQIGRKRENDEVSKEIEKIRGFIQTLTSAANPLGKLFDFLQEDVDEMQRELQHWKNINEKLQQKQRTESELGKLSLEPLRKQLMDVENSIKEEYALIAAVKTTILENDDRIMKLSTGSGLGPKTRFK